MKTFFFLLIFSISTSLSFAQWTVQLSGTTNTLNSVFLKDSINGWAVGEGGTILKFDGSNWTTQTNSSSNTLNSVFMLNNSEGYAVGNNGTILKYDGTNWVSQNSGTTIQLNSVYFIDSNTGYAVGGSSYGNGIILKYNSNTWTSQNVPNLKPLNCITFIDSTHGWAVGGGYDSLYNIYSYILKYDNNNWVVQTSPNNNILNSVYFPDVNHGWAVSSLCTIIEYNGISWGLKSSKEANAFFSVFGTDNNNIWLVGSNSSAGIVKKYDGSIWSNQQFATSNALPKSVFFIDQNHGWIVGGWGKIFYTSNGGFSNINEPVINDSFNIFPNPSYNRIEITGLNNGTIEIFNIQGQIIKTLNSSNTKTTIDISELSGGVYILRAKTDKGIITKKLIKD